MQMTPVNRIVQGMLEWQSKERAMADLFSPSTLQTRYFQQIKLQYFRDLRRSAGRSSNPEEWMTAKILKGEMKQLERKLYPNVFARLTARVMQGVQKRTKPLQKEVPGQRTDWLLKIDHRKEAKENGKYNRKINPRPVNEPSLKFKRTTKSKKI